MPESDPRHASNGKGQIPAWMQSVEEDTFYNAETTEEASVDSSAASTDGSSDAPQQNPFSGTSERSAPSSFDENVALSMAEPADIPTPDPDLQPTPVGRVRADLDRQLEKAMSVLTTRYASGVSRSLVLEYALQRTLVNLRREGDGSALVQWLDSVLPRS